MTAPSAWDDALLAASLFAIDPAGLGGLIVRARAGEVRDRFMREVQGPTRRLPPDIGDEALLGGTDIAATLVAGQRVLADGLLASLKGCALVAPMAEIMSARLAARLAAWLDGQPDGLVLLDESADADEGVPAALQDRLAFMIDLTPLGYRDAPPGRDADRVSAATARAGLGDVFVPDELVVALCSTSAALGIASPRVILLALRAARAMAALTGRKTALAEDAAAAARLVLSPRATMQPSEKPDESTESPAPDQQPERQDEAPQDKEQDSDAMPNGALEVVLQAARAAIPDGLLAGLQSGTRRGTVRKSGATGARQAAGRFGRPIGVRAAKPGAGFRLSLLETLRAAAPWQRLRADSSPNAIKLRSSDFRVVRTEQRTGSTTIFLVDASGSAALARLAEAKGAVELLLADCYRRRDQVAVIAFRGKGAQTLLPPTRSLVRAKRSLAALPGGGGTPLAAGIDAALALADQVRRGGATPTIVLLTDGRANVTRAGTGGRAQAAEDALKAARLVRSRGFAALVLDTSPRPAAEAGALARTMDARYVPLPYADAARVSRAMRAALPSG